MHKSVVFNDEKILSAQTTKSDQC